MMHVNFTKTLLKEICTSKSFYTSKFIMKKNLIVISLCALVCFTSCESHKEKEKEETKFLVTSPIRMDTAISKDYVCQIRSIQHIEMRALEKGYLQEIFVDEGQSVKKGQLMFQIMPMLYKAELQKAQAEANFVEIEYQNTAKLAESNVVAPNELALAKAKLEKAKAELALARVHLGFTEIRAPFNGIMDRFRVRLGSLVDEGDLLTTLSDNSKMWVYFNVPEAEYLEYESNIKSKDKTQVSLIMANGRKFNYPGVVETIEAEFNNETGNIAFRATFPNPNGLLRHGETGNVLMTTPLKNAMLIPQRATFEILDKRYVYVVDKDDIIRSRVITIAAEMPHIYVVQDGLEVTDKILLDGLRLVKENDKISYEFKAPQEVLTHLDLYAE
jgi:membrane fusion protein (multidrug efflux system)